MGIRRLAELTKFFDKGVVDGITNGLGVAGYCIGEDTCLGRKIPGIFLYTQGKINCGHASVNKYTK